jgi:hypothetical protein
MYRQTGFCRFLGFFGLWKINNLPVFSAPWPFDSVPGHHLYSFREQRLFVTSRAKRYSGYTTSRPLLDIPNGALLRTWHSLAHGTQANHVHFVGMGSLNR